MPSAALIAKANEPRSGKAWFRLYDIELQTSTTESRWVLLTSSDQNVIYRGRTYLAYPITHDSVKQRAGGALPSVQLTIGNFDGVAEQYLRSYDGLEGRRVRIRRVHEDLVTSDADTVAYDYTVRLAKPAGAVVVLELGEAPLHEVAFPSTRLVRGTCQDRFRGPRCGWAIGMPGNAASCDYSLDGANGCVAHGNEDRFGATPSLPEPL